MHRFTASLYAALVLVLGGCGDGPVTTDAGTPGGMATGSGSGSPTGGTASLRLDHWKLQLPDGRPDVVGSLGLEERTRSGEFVPYFYYDDEGALVLFTRPLDTTPNSHYSRTELREQLEPGRDDVNWTLDEGGRLQGRLAVPSISHDGDGQPHRTIIMQIHGRLSDEQAARIGADGRDAPPLLKIYWQRGQIRLLFKKLRDLGADEDTILHKAAWTDDEPYVFPEPVDERSFELRVEASAGRILVTLNGDSHLIETPSLARWPFENYFKAGNYLQTRDAGAEATVVYYALERSHL